MHGCHTVIRRAPSICGEIRRRVGDRGDLEALDPEEELASKPATMLFHPQAELN